jgi:hypothetical protein
VDAGTKCAMYLCIPWGVSRNNFGGIVKYILFAISFLLVLGFQNCSKVGFNPDTSSSAFKSGRDAGDDGLLGGGVEPGDDGSMGDGEIPGDDGSVGGRDDDGDDSDVSDIEDDKDWLYIPGGRGHVPMSSVAICPADSKDAGNQKCPMFCFEGKDYVMHKSLARNYFAKKFDRLPNYGGGAVPGTCAAPNLLLKR